MAEPQMTVDVQKFFKAYEARIAELVSRVIYLEIENDTYREALAQLQAEVARPAQQESEDDEVHPFDL